MSSCLYAHAPSRGGAPLPIEMAIAVEARQLDDLTPEAEPELARALSQRAPSASKGQFASGFRRPRGRPAPNNKRPDSSNMPGLSAVLEAFTEDHVLEVMPTGLTTAQAVYLRCFTYAPGLVGGDLTPDKIVTFVKAARSDDEFQAPRDANETGGHKRTCMWPCVDRLSDETVGAARE